MDDMKRTTIYIPKEHYRVLRRLAFDAEVTVSHLIRYGIEMVLQEAESSGGVVLIVEHSDD